MPYNTVTDEEMLRILHAYNPWWMQKSIPQSRSKPFKRQEYEKISKKIHAETITALVGARRVGKTTIIYQMIEQLLKTTRPQNILLAFLDDPHFEMSLKTLEKMFSVYATSVLKEELGSASERVYIILDEIQALEDWQSILKNWFDMGYNIKFIITGSSSRKIFDGSSESLVGRINYNVIHPLKFSEYVRFKDQAFGNTIHDISKKISKAFKTAISANDHAIIYDELKHAKTALIAYEPKIRIFLEEYMIKGGYPENVLNDDMYQCADNLKTHIQLSMYKDVIDLSGARDPSALKSLFVMIARESSAIFSRTNVASTLGINRSVTLNHYMRMLNASYLISESAFYSKSAPKSARKETKAYINDIGIRNAAASTFDSMILSDSAELGRIAETIAADHTRRIVSDITGGTIQDIFYWHERYEVDIVAEMPQSTLPIEVKYRENVTLSELKGIQKFKKKFNPSMSIVVTKNQLDMQNGIIFIPFWMYLMMC